MWRALTFVSVSLASCAGVPKPPPGFTHGDRRALLPAAEAAIAALHGLQPGLDPVDASTDWRMDDRVLYGIELADSGTIRQWLLELRLDLPFELGGPMDITFTTKDGKVFKYVSPCMPGKLTLHGPFLAGQAEPDPAAMARPARRVNVPAAFLREGMVDACEQRIRLAEHFGREPDLKGLSDADVRSALAGEAALAAFLLIVQREDSLAEVLWQVIDKPSFLSLLSSVFSGVAIYVDAALDRAVAVAEPVPGQAWQDAGYQFPITLAVNGTPALHASILVTKPRPPLQLAAGIVSIEGSNPSHPERRIHLWVISARRGSRLPGALDRY